MGITAGGNILEAKGWKELTEGISDPMKRGFVAVMLENYRQYRLDLDESTTTMQIGNYDKWAFPILSIVSENLIAQDLVSVQPLDGPSGIVFYMNFVTGQAKGSTPKGASIFDSRTGKADRYLDSSDRVEGESLGTTSSGDLSSVNLSYLPVVPATVSFTFGDTTLRDDGNGALVDGSGVSAGTVNYTTGAVAISTSHTDGAVSASYNYNSELNPEAQQVDIEIASTPIYAQERKLRARWSMEAAKAMEALHKVNAENMVSTAITNTLSWEIDREIIENLRRSAGAGLVRWSAVVPSGAHISYTEHKLSFIDAMTTGSNFIYAATNRVKANWMVTGIQGANVVETLPNFEPAGGNSAEADGATLLGKIGRAKIYSDPHYRDDEALMGYKGNDYARTGAIFAPWILLYTTPVVMLDDFMSRKGFASQYGFKLVNSKFYSKILLSGQTAQFGA